MKIRLIAILLLLTMLVSAFAGCGGKKEGEGETTTKVPSGDTSTPDDTGSTPGDDTGSTPGDDTGSTPGDDTGSTPGDDTGSTPGDDTGSTPGDDDPDTPSGATLPEGMMPIVENGTTLYQIVTPRFKAGAELVKSSAEELAALIAQETGVDIPVVDDYAAESDYEIRVARLGRLDAVQGIYKNYSKFGDLDFAIEVEGNHIYIYGTTMQAVVSGMTYFTKNVLYTDTGVAGIQEGYSLIYEQTDMETIVLTGSDENYVYFTMDEGKVGESHLRISLCDNNGWRLQTKSQYDEAFDDMGASQLLSYTMGEEPLLNVYPITVEEVDGKVIIRQVVESGTAGSRVEVDLADTRLDFYNASGELSASITNITSNLGGSTLTGKLNPNEAVYGTGERFNSVNQRGEAIHMFSKDVWSSSTACYMVIPLLCFSRGSGIFLNHYEEMNLKLGTKKNMAKEDDWEASIVGATLDCYVYTTEYMSEAIKGYTDLSGHAEMPAEWTYGMLICRYSPDLSQKWSVSITSGENQNGRGMGVYDTIALMEKYDLPWTGILAEGWGPYKGSKHNDLEELCDYTHSLGKKFLVYMRVGWADSDQSGFDDSYLLEMVYPNGTVVTKLPSADTNNPDAAGSSGAAYPYLDISDPAACEWFFGTYWDYLANDVGVDGCKIDFCETLPEYYTLNYYDDTIPTAGSHHWYPTAFCAKFFEMISSKPDSGMCYTRGGGIGAQRAPYMWAGDQKRCYESLDYQLQAVLSSGMSGVPFMSYDMSGYQYGDADQSPAYEGQVFVRGLQFTAFTICMQQHGKVRQSFEFAEGDIRMTQIYSYNDSTTGATVYTTSGSKGPFVRWCKMTTGGLDTATGYYKGINPATRSLYSWVYDENDNIKTAKVYQDSDGKYTLTAEVKDKDGNVIKNTYVRTVQMTDGTFNTSTGYFNGYVAATGKLESDGIQYVYEIEPGSMTYITDIYRGYVKLHELLTPYITELSAEACETGMPVMRILGLHWQDDPTAHTIDNEYTFGDAFLVAPVLDNGYSRDVYLPAGEWIDLNTGIEYSVEADANGSGMWLYDYSATLAQLPLFYNKNTTSEVAPELLDGIQEIINYLNTIPLPAVTQ